MNSGKVYNNLSFKEEKGCFLQRWALVALVLAFVLCLMTIGLLVGYLKPCNEKPISEEIADEMTAPKTLPYVRLPRSVVPEHYDIELQPYLIENNFTFDGKVRIMVKVLQPTKNVTLHINNVTVDAGSVRMTDIHSRMDHEIVSKSQDEEKEFYILHLKRNLKEGATYEIFMKYVGSLNNQLVGFYRSSYKDSDGNKR